MLRSSVSAYHAYLLSPRWRGKRREVWARCGGLCERCHRRRMAEVHHKTYERLFHEDLRDLLGLCRPCHRFITWRHRLVRWLFV